MGAGIVEVLARSGLRVLAAQREGEAVERGRAHQEPSTARAVGRGKLTQEAADELLGRITPVTSLADLAAADLVVEAVPEQLELEAKVLGEVDRVCGPD